MGFMALAMSLLVDRTTVMMNRWVIVGCISALLIVLYVSMNTVAGGAFAAHVDRLACLDLPPTPARDPDVFYYDSVSGLVLVVWTVSETIELRHIYTVADLAHEDAADYSIKTSPFPTAVQLVQDGQVSSWYDQVGEGRCEDYKKRQ